MHFMYKITNQLNQKVYIGQTINPKYRWYQHRSYAGKENKNKQYIHRAMAKYGIENFQFEIIASCRTPEDANETENSLIKQYDSRNKEYGYNLAPGGGVGSGKDHPSYGKKQSLETIAKRVSKLVGQKRTPEQIANISRGLNARDHDAIYTPEVRQKMSASHMGNKPSEEAVQKQSESLKKTWERRNNKRFATEDIRCHAPGCEVSGKAKYKIIDGVRYCNKHGLRMLRNGITDCLPPFKYTEDNPMSEEVRKKCGAANIGRVAHNRIIFTEEQIEAIVSDNRSVKKIAKDFQVTEKVIKRIKLEYQ
jgi:group I intron endonuclease